MFLKPQKPIIERVEEEIVEGPFIDSLIDLGSQIGSILGMYPLETVVNRLGIYIII